MAARSPSRAEAARTQIPRPEVTSSSEVEKGDADDAGSFDLKPRLKDGMVSWGERFQGIKSLV